MERNAYFDNCKAILIILVVIGHIVELFPVDNILICKIAWVVIYSFHMPAFFFIAGYFAKNRTNHSKSVLRFLFIYILTTILVCPFLPDNLILSLLAPYAGFWFFLSLASCFFILNFMPRNISPKITVSFVIVCGIAVGYFNTHGILAIPKTLYFFAYFWVGYCISRDQFNRVLQAFKSRLPIALIAVCTVFIALMVGHAPRAIFWASRSYAILGYTQWYAGVINLFAYGFGFLTLFCFFALIPKSKHLWTIIGQYTLYIYIGHVFLMHIIISIVESL